MKRWQIVLVLGFLVFGIYQTPDGSADRAREYGSFVLEGLRSGAEFADSLFDSRTAATSTAG